MIRLALLAAVLAAPSYAGGPVVPYTPETLPPPIDRRNSPPPHRPRGSEDDYGYRQEDRCSWMTPFMIDFCPPSILPPTRPKPRPDKPETPVVEVPDFTCDWDTWTPLLKGLPKAKRQKVRGEWREQYPDECKVVEVPEEPEPEPEPENPAPVPLPAGVWLLLAGLGAMVGLRRRI